jgi:hypothetical protein
MAIRTFVRYPRRRERADCAAWFRRALARTKACSNRAGLGVDKGPDRHFVIKLAGSRFAYGPAIRQI